MTDDEILEYLKNWLHIVLKVFFFIASLYFYFGILVFIFYVITDITGYEHLFPSLPNPEPTADLSPRTIKNSYQALLIITFFASWKYRSLYKKKWLVYKNKKNTSYDS